MDDHTLMDVSRVERAPKTPRRDRRRLAGGIFGVLLALGAMPLLASPALAAGPPVFDQSFGQLVHSTRATVEGKFGCGGLLTEWTAEYSESETGPWKFANSQPATCVNDSEEVHLGPQDPGLPESALRTEPNEVRHLNPGRQYFARFVARNSAGSAERVVPFKTPAAARPEVAHTDSRAFVDDGYPRFELSPTEPLTSTAAGFHAKLETNGAQTEYSFEYSLPEAGHAPAENSPSWTSFSSGATGTITVAEDFALPEASVTGLTPETTYYVRLKATNSQGTIVQTKYNGKQPGEEPGTFTTLTAKPSVGNSGFKFRNVTATSVAFSEGVAPHGSETGWRFEYEKSSEGGSGWKPVPGASGTISAAEAKEAGYFGGFTFGGRLSGLVASTAYSVRMVVESTAGKAENVGGFETSGAPSDGTFLVHALHGEAMRLLGEVNPNSSPTSAEQVVTVGGSPTGGTFKLKFKGNTTVPIAYNADGETVRRALTGLPGEPKLNVEGPRGGPYTVFWGDQVAQSTLEGDGSELVPSGTPVTVTVIGRGGEAYDTHYRFQYVSASAFAEHGWEGAEETPEQDAGSGSSVQLVGVDAPGMQPGETYRYRMVASNNAPGTTAVYGSEQSLTVPSAPVVSPVVCPNEAFRTGLSAHLSDCRAYEMLTPVDKNGAKEPFSYVIAIGSTGLAATDGEHFSLEAPQVSWGTAPGAGQNPYQFAREEGVGWRMAAGAPQPETGFATLEPQVYDSGVTRIALASAYQPSKLGLSETIEYKVGPAGGPYKTVATVPRPPKATGEGWVASSADFSKLVLATEDRTLLSEAPSHTLSGKDLYEYTAAGGLVQLNVTTAGATLGSCGATIAHGVNEAGGRSHSASGPHSVSADGSRVFFYADAPGRCSSEGEQREFGPNVNLYMRLHGGSEHAETLDLGSYRFLAANASGSRLLLEDSSGAILGYDTETQTTEAPSASETAAEKEIATVTAETVGVGKNFHFNLTEPSETETFAHPHYVYFGFRKSGNLPEAEREGTLLGLPSASPHEVYRYDSVEHLLECISCASSYDPEPKGESFTQSVDGEPHLEGGLPVFTNTSANGDIAFFTTTAALVPQDVDGELPVEHLGEEYDDVAESTSPSSDVYEWRRGGVYGCGRVQGCLSLITDGRGGYKNLLLGSADEGRDVFIYTRSKLLPQDVDTSGDVYDVRINGGFPPAPPAPLECEGDACSSPPPSPLDPTPSSFTFSGVGNLLAPGLATAPTVVSGPPSKQQRLAAALKQCRRRYAHSRRRRVGCERAARRSRGARRAKR